MTPSEIVFWSFVIFLCSFLGIMLFIHNRYEEGKKKRVSKQ